MTNLIWITIAIFILCYGLFVVFPHHRSIIACLGGLAMIITGASQWQDSIFHHIHWNVIGLFFGTLILADLFKFSRVPAIFAEWLVDHTKTVCGAMVAICGMASFLSAFVENVAVVMLIAPVALSLAEKLKISPVRLIICLAVCTNLQGTATLIGDPPSMILAGYLKLTFNDFFFYQGRASIFWAVQIGGVAALLVVWWLLRRHREPVQIVPIEKVKSWFPSILLLILIIGLSLVSHWDPDFKWLAGTMTMVLAVIGLVWHHIGPKWTSTNKLLRELDWDTTFFLIGVFMVVGGLSESGVLNMLANWIAASVGDNLLLAYIVIILVAVVISAFVDNVPFLLAMIPVVQQVADIQGAPVPLLLFGLLIGACLGGNITPIGASANIVSVGLLRKEGYQVTFREFMGVGVPFTIAAVITSSIFVWWIWAP